MSTLVFVDPESSTQADGAQSSRLPVPLLEDPYEAIRHSYLDGMDTKSEPFEDPIDTETLELPLTVAPPASLPESTPPALVPILCRTAHMAMRVSPEMSSGLSASMAEVAAMFESALREFDSDSVSKDAEDEGPIVEDKDPAAGNEGLAAGVEGLSTDDESYGLDDKSHGIDDESRGLDDKDHNVESDGLGLEVEEEEAVPWEDDYIYNTFEIGQGSGSALESERPERVSASKQPTLTIWTDSEDGMVYIDVPTYPPPQPVQTPPSPEWTSGSLPISPSHSVVPSPVREVKDEIFSQRYRFRSLEYKQKRVVVTFGAIWRLVLALESWTGQTDAHRAALWHAISDMQGENQDLWLQLAEERRARLELAEVVNGIRRG
ncbi:hypothetical protein Tco_0436129 [Tanacetum coccineum]